MKFNFKEIWKAKQKERKGFEKKSNSYKGGHLKDICSWGEVQDKVKNWKIENLRNKIPNKILNISPTLDMFSEWSGTHPFICLWQLWIVRHLVAESIGIHVGRGVDPWGVWVIDCVINYGQKLCSVCRQRWQGDWLGPGSGGERRKSKIGT